MLHFFQDDELIRMKPLALGSYWRSFDLSNHD